jgi:hypothetical protein
MNTTGIFEEIQFVFDVVSCMCSAQSDFSVPNTGDCSTLAKDLSIATSPGFPDTLFSTVFQLGLAVAALDQRFHDHSSTLIFRVAMALERIAAVRNEQERLLVFQADDVLHHFDELSSMTTALNGSTGLDSKSCKQVVDRLWSKYSIGLAYCLGQRRGDAARRALADYSPFVPVTETFHIACDSLARIGERISDAGLAVRQLAEKIDFETDFSAFVKHADLKFVDVSPPPFERFKFSSRYAAPDVCVIERFTMPYLPISIARAKAAFEAQSQDELSLKKGQSIYLMQRIQPWVLAMTRVYAICGFVPGEYVEILGIGIAAGEKTGKESLIGRKGGKVSCKDSRGNAIAFFE